MNGCRAVTTWVFAALAVAVLGACAPNRIYESGKILKDCAGCPEMVVIPAGSFGMGDLDGSGASDETPVHRVAIDRPFAMGRYEVTQAEWTAVMGNNPSRHVGERNPVEGVSWDDAKAFVRDLSRKTGKSYRLPSEAEWEYAARAGLRMRYPWGDNFDPSKANNGGYGSGALRPVGSYAANDFGLYDVIGNVWEWTEDCWHENYKGAPSDGSAWTEGDCTGRVMRGGAFFYHPRRIYVSDRNWNHAGSRGSFASPFGLRVVRELE